jgi:hypothetical protein
MVWKILFNRFFYFKKIYKTMSKKILVRGFVESID